MTGEREEGKDVVICCIYVMGSSDCVTIVINCIIMIEIDIEF